MTRVNVVPVGALADQHLFAEFRELKMVPMSLRRSLRAHHNDVDALLAAIPPTYRLGRGHVSFFYDKGLYLQRRYSDVCRELELRGVNYDRNALLDPLHVFQESDRLRNDYVPTPEAVRENLSRIAERLAARPGWYRWTRATLPPGSPPVLIGFEGTHGPVWSDGVVRGPDETQFALNRVAAHATMPKPDSCPSGNWGHYRKD